jgi:hypothetical protein
MSLTLYLIPWSEHYSDEERIGYCVENMLNVQRMRN